MALGFVSKGSDPFGTPAGLQQYYVSHRGSDPGLTLFETRPKSLKTKTCDMSRELWYCLAFLIVSSIAPATSIHAQSKPLRVFILAGQSNMEGHAKVETFDYIGDDPSTRPLLEQMRDANGQPRVCEGAWISYFTGSGDNNGEGIGKLTAGYGARRQPNQDGGKIGPEFTFGLTKDAAFDEPVLIIKTAWGGNSLHTDFRTPSAGPFPFSETQLANLAKQGKDIDAVRAEKVKATGSLLSADDRTCAACAGRYTTVCPVHNDQTGFELAGFVWLQGWNDLVDSGVYPNRSKPGGYNAYSDALAHFIRDVRRDLNAPNMPFVIGVLGVGGAKANPQTIEFRKAMAGAGSATRVSRQCHRRGNGAVLVRRTGSYR